MDIEKNKKYVDLLGNKSMCEGYQKSVRTQGVSLAADDEIPIAGSTDQDDVSQIVPALHALIGIPVNDGAGNHTRQFTEASGTEEAHRRNLSVTMPARWGMIRESNRGLRTRCESANLLNQVSHKLPKYTV